MNFSEVQIARVKEYWDRRPYNIRHSTQPIGTKEYFDDVEARKYLVEPGIRKVAREKGAGDRASARIR
jgi:hypothetical protein